MLAFFHTILTQPLLNALIWIYNIVPGDDFGIAIVVLTILIRLILVPAFQKSLRAQKDLQGLQPKLDELREKYKDDREAQTKAVLDFYRENKISPFSSCLPLLIQLPILIALYRVFLLGLNGQDLGPELYGFVANPGQINTMFLGFIDLGKSNIVFALLAGGFQFIQSKMITPKTQSSSANPTSSIMTKQLLYVMPLITIFIAARLPAGLSLYWVVTTIFAIAQQYYILRTNDNRGTSNN